MLSDSYITKRNYMYNCTTVQRNRNCKQIETASYLRLTSTLHRNSWLQRFSI